MGIIEEFEKRKNERNVALKMKIKREMYSQEFKEYIKEIIRREAFSREVIDSLVEAMNYKIDALLSLKSKEIKRGIKDEIVMEIYTKLLQALENKKQGVRE